MCLGPSTWTKHIIVAVELSIGIECSAKVTCGTVCVCKSHRLFEVCFSGAGSVEGLQRSPVLSAHQQVQVGPGLESVRCAQLPMPKPDRSRCQTDTIIYQRCTTVCK